MDGKNFVVGPFHGPQADFDILMPEMTQTPMILRVFSTGCEGRVCMGHTTVHLDRIQHEFEELRVHLLSVVDYEIMGVVVFAVQHAPIPTPSPTPTPIPAPAPVTVQPRGVSDGHIRGMQETERDAPLKERDYQLCIPVTLRNEDSPHKSLAKSSPDRRPRFVDHGHPRYPDDRSVIPSYLDCHPRRGAVRYPPRHSELLYPPRHSEIFYPPMSDVRPRRVVYYEDYKPAGNPTFDPPRPTRVERVAQSPPRVRRRDPRQSDAFDAAARDAPGDDGYSQDAPMYSDSEDLPLQRRPARDLGEKERQAVKEAARKVKKPEPIQIDIRVGKCGHTVSPKTAPPRHHAMRPQQHSCPHHPAPHTGEPTAYQCSHGPHKPRNRRRRRVHTTTYEMPVCVCSQDERLRCPASSNTPCPQRRPAEPCPQCPLVPVSCQHCSFRD